MAKTKRIGGDRHKVRSLARFNLDEEVFVSRTEYIAEPQPNLWTRKMMAMARQAAKGNVMELYAKLNQVQRAALIKYCQENGITIS